MDNLQQIYKINIYNRFDLMAKILYIKYNTKWYIDLYKNNIQTFNGGWEPPGTKKNITEFIHEFNELILSLKKDGFKPEHAIPIGYNKVIVNGAHRLAISYIHNIEPKFNQVNNNGNVNYNYKFFKNRNPTTKDYMGVPNRPTILNGMEQKYMDRMALEFCFHIKNFKLICLFPSATKNDNKVEQILNKNGLIYYHKRIKIKSKNMLSNLISELYRGEQWIGGFFPGYSTKANLCWGIDDFRIYLFVPNNTCNVVNMKKDIRDIYKIKNHSIHIHDTYQEGLRIAKTVLNQNSVDFLNKSPLQLSNKNKKLFGDYYNSIMKLNSEDYCIDSSFILSLYNIREANDLDYLSLESKQFIDSKDISCHNKYSHHYTINKDDIVNDPDNHFYFAGIKCTTLELVKQMKQKRNESKDVVDVQLINDFELFETHKDIDNTILKLFTFCVFINRHSKKSLIDTLNLLIISLDKNVKDYELCVFTNFTIPDFNKNIKICKYFDKNQNLFGDKWMNLSFNKINIYKYLHDTYKEDYTWIDIDTLVCTNIGYLKDVDNVFIENGGDCKNPSLLFRNNKQITIPRNRYIQGDFWKLNIKLYNNLMKTFEEILEKKLKLRYDLQDLFSYHFYIKLQGEIKENNINILGNSFKPNTINGLGVWNKTKPMHASKEGLEQLYIENNILKSKLYPMKEIHLLSFTFYTLQNLKKEKKFKSLFT